MADAEYDEEPDDERYWRDPDDEPVCWYCHGEGWGIVGNDWDSDDPINGPYDGDVQRCPNCGGSGNAKDCTFW